MIAVLLRHATASKVALEVIAQVDRTEQSHYYSSTVKDVSSYILKTPHTLM